jgi:hypothetical protein
MSFMPDRRGVLAVFIWIRKTCVLQYEQNEKTNSCIWYNGTSAIKRLFDFGLIDRKWMENWII